MLNLCRTLFIRSRSSFGLAAASSGRTLHTKRTSDSRKNFPREPASDPLMKSIFEAPSLPRLIDILEKHGEIMSKEHMISFLRAATSLTYREESPTVIIKDPQFDALLNRLADNVDQLSPLDCFNIIGSCLNLKLSFSSKSVQAVCHRLASNLSEVGLPLLDRLSLLTRKIKEESVVTETLKMTIPMAFQSKVFSELKPIKKDCLSALHFVLDNRMPPKVFNFVLNAAIEHVDEFSFEDCLSVLSGASKRVYDRRSDRFTYLLEQCLETISRDITRLNDTEFRRVLAVLIHYRIPSRSFFDKAWLVAPTYSLPVLEHVILSGVRMNMLMKDQAEALKNIVIANEEDIRNGKCLCLDIARGMAQLAAQSPENGGVEGPDERLSEAIDILASQIGHFEQSREESPLSFVSYMLSMAALGHFPAQHLDTLFSSEFQKKLRETRIVSLLQQVEECASVYYGDDSPYKLIPELKRIAEDSVATFPKSIAKALEMALGGPQFVATNMQTPSGLNLQLLIAMRQGEYPISFSTGDTLQDFPSDCKVIAVRAVRSSRAVYEDSDMKNLKYALFEKHLRQQNIGSHTIYLDRWDSWAHNERIPKLMEDLKKTILLAPQFGSAEKSVRWT